MHPIVYDLNMRQQAILENATNIGYIKNDNKLWTGQFTLPADDPKNDWCQPFYFVRLFEKDGSEVGLFRIMPTTWQRGDGGRTKTYQLEHVMGTLLDDIVFQYRENDGLTTADNISYILGFQETQRWVLGQCDFERFFSYKYENDKLYNFLQAIVQPLDDEYLWTWDTSVYPWKLNLIKSDSTVTGRIRYAHNLAGITRSGDPRDCVTRMYGLGYGEGVNQLTIESANPTGLPYIDADTQGQFGIISDIIADKRFTHAETLYAYVKAELEKVKIPPVSYKVQAADVHPITGQEIDKLDMGKMVHVVDDDLGIKFDARIITYKKPDVNGDPGNIQLEIARRGKDITQDQADLRNRQRINEVNAQGATNIYTYPFNENCDSNYPAIQKFYLPPEAVKVNKVYITFDTMKFRGYVKSMKSAGQVIQSVTSGPSSTSTTAAGGGKTSGPSSTSTTAAGGSATKTSSAGGNHRHVMWTLGGGGTMPAPVNYYNYDAWDGVNNMALPLTLPAGSGPDAETYEASGDHTHEVDIPAHDHGMDHDHSIPDHEHGMDHDHKVDINIPGHIHEQVFGIWEAPNLPASITLKVDGNVVPNVNLSEENLDIKDYLSKDSQGEPQVGAIHEIEIYPSDLAKISANIFVQIFIQSRI